MTPCYVAPAGSDVQTSGVSLCGFFVVKYGVRWVFFIGFRVSDLEFQGFVGVYGFGFRVQDSVRFYRVSLTTRCMKDSIMTNPKRIRRIRVRVVGAAGLCLFIHVFICLFS